MGIPDVSRVYGPDLMLAVWERSVDEGWSNFFYDGAPGIAEVMGFRQAIEYVTRKIG